MEKFSVNDLLPIGFIGLSPLIEEAIKDIANNDSYQFVHIDPKNDEQIVSFEGIIIADLTRFENVLDKVSELMNKIIQPENVFLIHAYNHIPEFATTLGLNWIHTDSINDELFKQLSNALSKVGKKAYRQK